MKPFSKDVKHESDTRDILDNLDNNKNLKFKQTSIFIYAYNNLKHIL
jgi:hypothetical protein